MYEWVDPNGNKWNHVPQTTVNVFDRVLNSLPLAVVVKRAPLELGENFNFWPQNYFFSSSATHTANTLAELEQNNFWSKIEIFTQFQRHRFTTTANGKLFSTLIFDDPDLDIPEDPDTLFSVSVSVDESDGETDETENEECFPVQNGTQNSTQETEVPDDESEKDSGDEYKIFDP